MFVIKVQYGEVTRRLVLQEPYTYQSLLQTVLSRFELSIASRGAQLRYIDPDGDLISMNTDAELSEALALINQSDAQPVLRLKLVVHCSDATCESPASEESVVFVSAGHQVHNGAASLSEEVKARLEETESLEAQIQEVEAKAQAHMVRLEEERLRVEEERRVLAAEEEARLALIEGERRRVLEEEEKARHLAEQAENARILHEQEEARKILAEEMEQRRLIEEEQIRAAQIALEEKEKARVQELEEMLQRCEIAVCAEREDSLGRISALLRMGCSVASLSTIFCEDLLRVATQIPSSEPREQIENQIEVFDDCVETGVISAEDEEESRNEPEPEPKVDWELQKALKEQECSGDAFPSSAQKRAVLEAGNRAENLATQLTEFYLIHNPGHVCKVPELVRLYQGREAELNRALMDRYRCDLSTFRKVAPVETPEDLEPVDLEPVAASKSGPKGDFGDEAAAQIALANPIECAHVAESNAQVPEAAAPVYDDKLSSAIALLVEMGIEMPMENMKEVLEKYNYNVEEALSELLS
uniref:PB1 domain-containing protein n=1 Tax=Cryptomonas curvata TaxID=233186 RepID=A0A6T8BRE7_9CRYP|mmetsp:Transcript_51744/g.108090  ORF Transcript_51744/g.108090 Transcript_51744/m.108090 type:complete len:531 (+) Transcript_51744:83-1675(+)